MHPLFCTEELLLQLGQHLAPRLQPWRCNLRALSALAQTSQSAALALLPLMRRLEAKERTRLGQLAHCIALLHALPIPLSCWRWVTDHAYDLPSIRNAAHVYITHNGRLVLLENSTIHGHISTVRVVRTVVTPSSGHAGVLTTCAFTRVRTLGSGHGTRYHYMGKRLQTRAFASLQELIYQLYATTRVGAEVWPSCFGIELSKILLHGSDYLPLSLQEGSVYPSSMRPLYTRSPRLFFLEK